MVLAHISLPIKTKRIVHFHDNIKQPKTEIQVPDFINKSEYDILGYEVRSVYYSKAILITHPDDKLGNYILVSINKNEMVATLKGWSPLYRCNLWQSNWQTNWRYPCFGMPESQLWSMDTLIATPELLDHQGRWEA